MQNGDEASPSIILAGQAILVKMLITLEPHDVFESNFVYYCSPWARRGHLAPPLDPLGVV